jgi:hypothetical protein
MTERNRVLFGIIARLAPEFPVAMERQLGRTVDRLERLQRRRQGEMTPPPLSVHLTR